MTFVFIDDKIEVNYKLSIGDASYGQHLPECYIFNQDHTWIFKTGLKAQEGHFVLISNHDRVKICYYRLGILDCG